MKPEVEGGGGDEGGGIEGPPSTGEIWAMIVSSIIHCCRKWLFGSVRRT